MLRRRARQVRTRPRRVRPVHDRRLGGPERELVLRPSSRSAGSTADPADARPQPELLREHGQQGGSREQPGPFEFLVNTNLDDIYNKVARGDYQDEYASPSPKVIRQYQIDSSKRKYVKINSGDQTNYLTMNLTQPPFDDLAVRRAMNWVMDRGALRKAWGERRQAPLHSTSCRTRC